jgi:hypothetical protein
MLSCGGRFAIRYFLVILAIIIYLVIDSFLCLLELCPVYRDRDLLINRLVGHIYANLFLVAWGSPPLLSLLLLRRPSFWRVLFHVATTFYPLLILTMTGVLLITCYVGTVLLVVSGAALVAGLPEAMAAGGWARGVYYAALLLWIFLVVALLS